MAAASPNTSPNVSADARSDDAPDGALAARDPFAPLLLRAADGATAACTPHGAHVAAWTPVVGSAPAGERLFLSAATALRAGAAIRGGVPVIFPQFADRGPLPKHGLVRTRAWRIVHPPGRHDGTGAASARFALADDAETRALWPHAFAATLDVRVAADRLEVALAVRNTGDAPFAFTAALHTYLRMADVGAVRVAGLGGVRYRDTAAGGAERTEGDDPLAIVGEVDRIYRDVPGAVVLREATPDGPRAVRVTQEGFRDVVLWNPGAAKGAALADLEPEGWRRMLCVEAAVVETPVTLAPDEAWTGVQRLEALA